MIMRKFLITAGNEKIQTYWMHLESTGPLAALDYLYSTMDPITAHGSHDTEIRVYEILSDWVWHLIQELDSMSFDPAILEHNDIILTHTHTVSSIGASSSYAYTDPWLGSSYTDAVIKSMGKFMN